MYNDCYFISESEFQDDEYTSIDLYNIMPSLPNLEGMLYF